MAKINKIPFSKTRGWYLGFAPDDVWPGASDSLLSTNAVAVQILWSLVRDAGYPIDHWDWQEMFLVPGKSRQLLNNRDIISRIFFERFNKEKEDWRLQIELAAKDSIDLAKKELGDSLDKDRALQLEATKKAHINALGDLSDKIKDRLASIRSIQTSMLLAYGQSWSFSDALTPVLTELPFFKFKNVDRSNRSLLFTTMPVTLHEKNPAAGINRSVQMGSFRVTLFIDSLCFWVTAFEDTINYKGYHHPHVDTNGNVCFGDAQSDYHQFAETGDLLSAFKLLQCVLTQYNPDNPYVSLYTFELAQKQQRDKMLAIKKIQELARQFYKGGEVIPLPPEALRDLREAYASTRFSVSDLGAEVYNFCQKALSSTATEPRIVEDRLTFSRITAAGEFSIAQPLEPPVRWARVEDPSRG